LGDAGGCPVKEFPNSYKDPLYASLDEATERKLELPKGLLSAIRTRGERSNADQVSEANAKTPYQFIPATRAAIIDKYGIDPMLSPENASEAAGLLLKESLKRNNNDPAIAVAEYHGGTNRKNWGPRTTAYVKRVVGTTPVARQAAPSATIDLPVTRRESMFDRAKAAQALALPESSIASVLAAYQGGQMNAEEKAAFEEDVNAGRVMLPAGQSLAGLPPANQIPVAVIDAFSSGKMAPEEEAALIKDVKDGLASLPPGRTLTKGGAARIPGAAPGDVAPAATQPIPTVPAPTIGQQIIGAGETALTLGTGMTGGAVGTAAGTIRGLAGAVMRGDFGTPQGAQAIERSATEGAQALTYAPRGQAGQEQVQAIGGALQNLPPIVGVATQPAMMAPLASAAAPVRAAAGQAVRPVVQAVRKGAERARDVLGDVVKQREDSSTFGRGSVGAAELPAATQRREVAAQMPVPFEGESALTSGQASRNFEQLQFEKESAKRADVGAPLRERVQNQSITLEKNFDALVDRAQPLTLDSREIGKNVDRAVVNKANYAMKRVNAAYTKAREAGEMEAPVDMAPVAARLTELEKFEGLAPNAGAIRREALRLGAVEADEAGALTGRSMSINDSEMLRQFVNDSTDWGNRREALVGKRMLQAIDDTTEGAGGEMFKAARKLRRDYAIEFENTGLTKRLLETKRGTSERRVAYDDVFKNVVLDSSLEEMNKVRATLISAGPDGRQAWADLKAKTIDTIKESAQSASQRDEAGRPLLSADKLQKSIRSLDREGKLESLFGKKQAQTMRDLGELASVIYTAPPGAINTSNTASALQVALDSLGTFAVTGIPAPAATALREAAKYARDRKLKQRIEMALREGNKPQAAPQQSKKF